MAAVLRAAGALAAWPMSLALGAAAVAYTCTLRVVHHTVRGRQTPLSLKGQVVIITGGAGGFGQAVVPQLLARGAVVYALDVVAEEAIRKTLEAACAEFTKSTQKTCGGELICVSADLCKAGSVAALAQRVRAERGEIYCVINNAGIVPHPRAAVEADTANTRKVFDVNFHSAAELTHECFGSMRIAKKAGPRADGTPIRSRVVNITSAAGLVSSAGMAAYTASKFALEAWSDATRIEMHDAFDVCLVEPFFAKTGIVKCWLHIPDEEMRKSCLGEQYILAKRRAEGWQDGSKPIMTPEFVAAHIMRAVTDPHPQDRYMVMPNVAVAGVIAAMLHLPNYFLVIDKLKRAITRREG